MTVPVSPEMTASVLADFSRRMQMMEKRQKRVLVGLSFLVLIALGWPFVLYTIMAERPRESRVQGTSRPKTIEADLSRQSAEPAVESALASTKPAVDSAKLGLAPTTASTANWVRIAPPTTAATTIPAPPGAPSTRDTE